MPVAVSPAMAGDAHWSASANYKSRRVLVAA